jgi:hypothetical protein
MNEKIYSVVTCLEVLDSFENDVRALLETVWRSRGARCSGCRVRVEPDREKFTGTAN